MKGVAAAPVSFGVFELTADGPLPEPDDVLRVVSTAGYDGIDLGPVGWLGDAGDVTARLRNHELSLCGGWVDLPFSDDQAFEAALPTLKDALEVFVAAADVDPERPPLPTLADSGSDVRRENPGGAAPGLELDGDGWARLSANVATATALVRDAGLEPTFHHHVGTYVETPAEIEQLLAGTEVGLTLDTGHLLLGGGDPLAALRRWASRINHVHVKDAQRGVLGQVLAEGGDMHRAWEQGVFVAVGAGDLELATFMDSLAATGFDGWVVVEQDVVLGPHLPPDRPASDQRANREALRRWFP